jgi:hypothetical protein
MPMRSSFMLSNILLQECQLLTLGNHSGNFERRIKPSPQIAVTQ